MSLIRWNPFHEMDTFARRFNELFGMSKADEWKPTVDIHETPEHFEIKAELPGVKKEDVALTLEAGVLTITGERKSEMENKEAKAHRIERFFGKFERVFTLPDTIDPDKIDAVFMDGVLTVKIAKRPGEPSKKRSVPIG